MEQFILKLGIMSLQACVVICVVLAVRAIFVRVGIARKYISILWGLPYVCMICPWKFEGDFGFRLYWGFLSREFICLAV